MFRVALLDDYQSVALSTADWSALQGRAEIEVFRRHFADVEVAAAALERFEVLGLMRERMPVSRALLNRLPNLRLIVVTGGRTRSIDFEAAAERGVVVSCTGGSASNATPELAWALILACARRIPDEVQRVRTGGWQESVGTTLEGKTLGLLGLGRLGTRMVPIAEAFGMSCIAWSPNLTEERAAAGGAKCVSRERLFSDADVVSIHLALGDRTRGLVGAEDLRRMKSSAILVNTSRGQIVQEAALLRALEEMGLRVGLDVFEIEPLPVDHPLRRSPNVVATPHLGFVTEENYRLYYGGMVESIAAWADGAPKRVLVAPST